MKNYAMFYVCLEAVGFGWSLEVAGGIVPKGCSLGGSRLFEFLLLVRLEIRNTGETCDENPPNSDPNNEILISQRALRI